MQRNNLLDANVILRYLIKDNQQQFEEACNIIKGECFVLTEVLAEVVYVLGKVYSIERNVVSKYMSIFLDDVDVDNKMVLDYAFEYYASTNLDFVDCILFARSVLLDENVFTFDKKLNACIEREKGMRLS